jgi:hypothetical protein
MAAPPQPQCRALYRLEDGNFILQWQPRVPPPSIVSGVSQQVTGIAQQGSRRGMCVDCVATMISMAADNIIQAMIAEGAMFWDPENKEWVDRGFRQARSL